jgi:DNA-binding MarR family transcriptional regulator
MGDVIETDLTYNLDDQVGYLLRLASQRHTLIFQRLVPEGLTPTQFSTIIRVAEHGEVSQNQLGRLAAMDVATIKGVVDRLRAKGLISSRPDPGDKRRSLISLTQTGLELVPELKKMGALITAETLAPLSEGERVKLLELIRKLV